MPCTCKIVQIVKSGWSDKSPPLAKPRSSFTRRWLTLGRIECCKEKETLLMLSYYKDFEEKKLQGRFNLRGCEVEQVFDIPERPKMKKEFILKLWLAHPERILYLCFKDEMEVTGWKKSLKSNIEKFSEYTSGATENEEGSEEDEEHDLMLNGSSSLDGSFENSSRISRQLTLLRDIRHTFPEADISPLDESFPFPIEDESHLSPDTLSNRLSGISSNPRLSGISNLSNRTSGFCSEYERNDSEVSGLQQRFSNISFSSSSNNSRDSGASYNVPEQTED